MPSIPYPAIIGNSFNALKYLAKKSTQKRLSKSIKEVMCENQGDLIRYSFLAGEKHKHLKDVITTKPHDPQEIANAFKCLENHLYTQLERTMRANFNHARNMLSWYKGCDTELIRICCKVHEYNKADNERYTVTMWPDGNRNTASKCKISENTASEKIYANGSYYIQNNIPEAMAHNFYKNPRINQAAFKSYQKNHYRKLNLFHRLRYKYYPESQPDYDWAKCWISDPKNSNEVPNPKECYKSTLVIPITLHNNKNLGKEFLELLCEKGNYTEFFSPKTTNTTHAKRYIYGYLCLDHPSPYLRVFKNLCQPEI